MQQNGPEASHPSRVQFPEQLSLPDTPRSSSRSLPRVSGHSRYPSALRIAGHPSEGNDRARTSSLTNSGRPEGTGLGIGHPTRSPRQGPSPLNPARRRGSGQHTHKKENSLETVDVSRYDIDDFFIQSNPVTEQALQVAPEHQDGIAKLLQRRDKAQKAHRNTRSMDVTRLNTRSASPADLLFAPSQPHRTPTSRSRPLDEDSSPHSGGVAEDRAISSTNQASTTVLSDSASSQDQGQHTSIRSSPMQSQDESWTDMFTRKSMEKNRSRRPLTEEQYLALERETDEKIAQIKAKAGPGSWERARITGDQLRRHYEPVFSSLASGQKVFNLMDVVRWRRDQFDQSRTVQVEPSPEDAVLMQNEMDALSWRPHLAELYDPRAKYRTQRLGAPWHLTALLMEQYLESLKPKPLLSASPNTLSPVNSNEALASKSAISHQTTPNKSDTKSDNAEASAEYDSNQSGAELLSRFDSLRRFRNSLPGRSKSPERALHQSPHQSRSSLSQILASPSSSRTHINKIISGFAPARLLGDHSEEGENSTHESMSIQEKGYDSSGSRKLRQGHVSRSSTPDKLYPSGHSEDDRAVRSSEDGKERKIKARRVRPFFSRDETLAPKVGSNGAYYDSPSPRKHRDPDLDRMIEKPDPDLRRRLKRPPPPRDKSREAREEKKRNREEKDTETAYERRERECQQLDDLIRTLNQEQYRLLQTGRKFAEHANRLSETFHWEHTHLLEDQALRTLTEPGSRSRAREEAESRSGDFVDRREIARRQAEHLHRAIKSEQFSLPISPNKYRTEEGNFRIENEKLKTVERDLDYFAQVAYSHIEKSARFEHSLISLRRSLSEAFTQTSQVSREISALEVMVATSRLVPTWKKISGRVKPLLSLGVKLLTWILKLIGAIGRPVLAILPPSLKNLFGWQMLSGSWPRFIFAFHLVLIFIIRRMTGWWYWSFEGRLTRWGCNIILAYALYWGYWAVGWYTNMYRHYVLTDWWDRRDNQKTWLGWLHRLGYGAVLIIGGLLPWLLLLSLLLSYTFSIFL